MNRAEWAEECTYIAEQADAFTPGKWGATEFDDRAQFLRYCWMQHGAVIRAGFADLAMRIQSTIDKVTP